MQDLKGGILYTFEVWKFLLAGQFQRWEGSLAPYLQLSANLPGEAFLEPKPTPWSEPWL